MVKITFAPTEEIVVHDVIELPLDDMLRGRVTPAGIMPLYWCNGILFNFSSMPMTEEVVRDYVRGKLHWIEVQFTKFPQYRPILSLNDDEYKQQVNVRVIDTSVSPVHQELTKWIKTNVKK